ncbi:hypothetical protein AAFX91_28000 [Bradyrhizobium sp. 31Argb]|uniref:hypothetical protein n=1 Tax=Bradyrhizobium sp. 31Argb TaxID=3141247 RepID=UPI003747E705
MPTLPLFFCELRAIATDQRLLGVKLLQFDDRAELKQIGSQTIPDVVHAPAAKKQPVTAAAVHDERRDQFITARATAAFVPEAVAKTFE